MGWRNRKESEREEPAQGDGSCLPGEASESEIRELEGTLREETLLLKRQWLSVVAATLIPVSAVLFVPALAHTRQILEGNIAFPCALFLMPFGINLLLVISSRRRSGVALKLIGAQNLQSAGPLAHWLLTTSDKRTIIPLARTLTNLLSGLEATDSHFFTLGERQSLRILLLYGGRHIVCGLSTSRVRRAVYRELQIATLLALTQIGNADDLTVVRKHAGATALTKDGTRLKTTAEECLAAIEARLAGSNGADSLLRPVSAEDTGLELLRAGSETVQASGELLRGAGSSSKETETPAIMAEAVDECQGVHTV